MAVIITGKGKRHKSMYNTRQTVKAGTSDRPVTRETSAEHLRKDGPHGKAGRENRRTQEESRK